MQDKLQKLEEILKIANRDVPSTDEVVQFFHVLVKIIGEVRQTIDKQSEKNQTDLYNLTRDLISQIDEALDKLASRQASFKSELTKRVEMDLDTLTKNLFKELSAIKDKIPSEDVEKLKQQMSQMEESHKEMLLGMEEGDDKGEMEAMHEEMMGEIEERLKGLEKKIEDGIRNAKSGGRGVGARGISLYTNGTKRGQAQTVNLIPGIGVSLSYDYASGRHDITINASASTSVLTATGTINDANVTFTFTSEPAILIINGASYQQTGGAITWSYSSGTVTLSSPVGTGGSIFGLA